MSRFPVIYRIDQKEKNNGASKSNCSIMGAVIHRGSFGRVHGWWRSLRQMAMGGVAAVVPVILRWLNPADKAFGSRGSDSETTRGRFSFDPFAKPCRVWLSRMGQIPMPAA
jgi:hypothetical protein